MAILKQLCACGHTVIPVTHDPAVARRAERIIEIRDGEIIADSRPAPQECAGQAVGAGRRGGFLGGRWAAVSRGAGDGPGVRWRPTRCAPR